MCVSFLCALGRAKLRFFLSPPIFDQSCLKNRQKKDGSDKKGESEFYSGICCKSLSSPLNNPVLVSLLPATLFSSAHWLSINPFVVWPKISYYCESLTIEETLSTWVNDVALEGVMDSPSLGKEISCLGVSEFLCVKH